MVSICARTSAAPGGAPWRTYQPVARPESFLDRYLEESGDYEGLPLLDLYRIYRSLVRAKVAYLEHQSGGDKAAGLDPVTLETHWPRIGDIPFSSERKRMTTLHRGRSGVIACSKGAPEGDPRLLHPSAPRTARWPWMRLSTMPSIRPRRQWAPGRSECLRWLRNRMPTSAMPICEMVFLGLIGLIDPPRSEAAQAIEICKGAGIRPVMITGDHANTGAAIAKEIGLLGSGRVVTGAELEAMSALDLARSVAGIEVYARVSPEHSYGWSGPGSKTATSSP
jgi:hypothetical protein